MKFTKKDLEIIKNALNNHSQILYLATLNYWFSSDYLKAKEKEMNEINKVYKKIHG